MLVVLVLVGSCESHWKRTPDDVRPQWAVASDADPLEPAIGLRSRSLGGRTLAGPTPFVNGLNRLQASRSLRRASARFSVFFHFYFIFLPPPLPYPLRSVATAATAATAADGPCVKRRRTVRPSPTEKTISRSRFLASVSIYFLRQA